MDIDDLRLVAIVLIYFGSYMLQLFKTRSLQREVEDYMNFIIEHDHTEEWQEWSSHE